MRRFGRVLLLVTRSFHFWHRQHLPVGVFLVVLGGLAAIAASVGHLDRRDAGLPSELEHLIGSLTVYFYAAYLALVGSAYLLARLLPPRVVPLVTGLPSSRERSRKGHWIFGGPLEPRFRYRFARPGELKDFVDYSAGDPAVFVANLDLTPEKRLELYARWQSLNSNCFMLLEIRGEHDVSWRTFAVSIVLPLTKVGLNQLWSGNVRVVQLDRDHILGANRRPPAILTDTLIVAPRDKGREIEMLFALPKIHLAQFGIPEGRKRIEYWIEPDHKKLPKLLPAMGFEGPHEISKGHLLFKLAYPIAWGRYSQNARETVSAFLADLAKVSSWHVE